MNQATAFIHDVSQPHRRSLPYRTATTSRYQPDLHYWIIRATCLKFLAPLIESSIIAMLHLAPCPSPAIPMRALCGMQHIHRASHDLLSKKLALDTTRENAQLDPNQIDLLIEKTRKHKQHKKRKYTKREQYQGTMCFNEVRQGAQIMGGYDYGHSSP